MIFLFMGKYPCIKLNSGIKIANFSSPHRYKFHTGEELTACEDEVANDMKLNENHYYYQQKGWEDVEIRYMLSDKIYDDLLELSSEDGIDIILVPYPVMNCVKESALKVGGASTFDGLQSILNKIRVCKLDDRVTKVIRSDKFCK
jgi:hypothetical protein|tara:strand:+ start:139 stop:573 length:435 start_codon:yes stop_codon:yes gene_type:complete